MARLIYDAYERLAIAIVQQAVNDYRYALRKLEREPDNEKAKWDVEQIECFFHSDGYKMLCDYDGEKMIERIKQTVKKNKRFNKKKM